jgi:AsmA protein
MKRWIVAAVLLLAFAVLAIVAVVNLNGLIKQHKDYLIAQAEAALGRKVEVGDVGVTLWGGIGARLKEFSIADDPSFSNEPFVRAADLQVNLKFLPLLQKQFRISRIILHRPVINIIRNKDGQFNFSTIGRGKDEKGKRENAERERPTRPERSAGPPPLLIALADVTGGEIRYTDRNQNVDFSATRLDSKVTNISFDGPIHIDLSAAVLGADKQNLKIVARVGPTGPTAELNRLPIEGDLIIDDVPLPNLEKALAGFGRRIPPGLEIAGAVGTRTHFSGWAGKDMVPKINGTLSLSAVRARIPELPQPITTSNAKLSFTLNSAELPETAFQIGKSKVRLAVKITSFKPLNLAYRLAAPELSLGDLHDTGAARQKPEVLKDLISDGSVSMKTGALSYHGNFNSPRGTIADGDYTNLQSTVSVVDRVATIESLSLGTFGGSLKAKGRYDMRENTPRFSAVTTVRSMDLTQISHSLRPSEPQNIRGLLDMDLDISGAGKKWDVIQKSLTGQGKAEVVNGALLDVNLADGVLSGAGIPGVISMIPSDMKKKYPDVFSSKDTEFKQMHGTATISDGRAYTDDLVVSAAEFESEGKGWFAFDRTVDFRGLFLVSQPFSADIIRRAKEAKGLANDQGRIEIPFTLSGKLPGAKPKPDVNYIARAFEKGFVENLFRKKPSKGDSASSAPSEGSPSEPTEKKKSNTEEQILRGLKKFFGR